MAGHSVRGQQWVSSGSAVGQDVGVVDAYSQAVSGGATAKWFFKRMLKFEC